MAWPNTEANTWRGLADASIKETKKRTNKETTSRFLFTAIHAGIK